MSWPGQVLVGSRVLEELRKKYFVQVVLKSANLIEVNVASFPPKTTETSRVVKEDIKENNIIGRIEQELREGGVSSFSIEMETCLAFSGEDSPVTIYVRF
ncbi:MAG: hypothetical protein COX90_01645 [Candidatus Nealsonbacteria bacterium CG_4_10_14_0_2_um_filter_38_17]|uniref:Uncharacterized protein n=2 Tax=Candidatus Nealsoniibacteriota TaxID=1817911 RepID=A0A2M7UYE8_9BACT|nr:MAG: hypothetical protein COX36_03495 [Candidatus Nealsonbacteria bacterium CG23_combo_of_CG06-09_8_20_14_all_38_19]PIZ89006.1 MAG: hypothetical protein COX90_01645 [Candidatus Nealsonbacteria bacterium CG_4_10_14_0_2_um_filter_38_17]